MPLYEYQCAACATRIEKIQKLSDPPPDQCPSCGKGPMVKQLSSPAIQFKGSGWYITDYAKKGGSSSDGGAKSEKTEKADNKTETKSDSASPASTPAPAAASKPSES